MLESCAREQVRGCSRIAIKLFYHVPSLIAACIFGIVDTFHLQWHFALNVDYLTLFVKQTGLIWPEHM